MAPHVDIRSMPVVVSNAGAESAMVGTGVMSHGAQDATRADLGCVAAESALLVTSDTRSHLCECGQASLRALTACNRTHPER